MTISDAKSNDILRVLKVSHALDGVGTAKHLSLYYAFAWIQVV
jgi:hypothetical protein